MNTKAETRIPIRIYNAVMSMVTGDSHSQFNADQLLEKAEKKFGLSDFGDENFIEGLRVLCTYLNSEANLHPFGRIAATTGILVNLRNRLELTARWKEHPGALTAGVNRPVFIVGQPRTGTTLLFNLLALDDRFRFIRFWEADRPGLPWENKRLIRKAKKKSQQTIDAINYIRPVLKKIHHVALEKPEECMPLLANSFESDFFPFAYNIESYFNWYLEQDHEYCYAYYCKQLQWIQSKTPEKRWLLKSPSHLGSFAALFHQFPDALVLLTHRDPEKIIPSFCSLQYHFQSMGTYTLDKKYIAAMAIDYFADSMQTVFELNEEKKFNIHDIQYKHLVRDPIGVLERIYAHMGETLPDDTKMAAKKYLIVNPKNKYGKHNYSMEEIGITKEMLHQKFDFYYNRFNFSGAE